MTSSVRDLILAYLVKETPGFDATTVADDANLVEKQIIDSVGLIGLILFLEAETGRSIDFLAIDPSRMMSIAGIKALFEPGVGTDGANG